MNKMSAQQFLLCLEENYVERMEKNCSDTFRTSAKHRRWIKHHIYGKRTLAFSRPLVRVASFFFAVLLLFSAFVVTSQAVRDTISDFFTDLFEAVFRIHPNPDYKETAPKHIEIEFVPTYIPIGYEFAEETRTDTVLSFTWKNTNGASITYHQCTLDVEMGIRAENTIERWISNRQILLHKGNGVLVCYWCTEEYQYSLHFTDAIEEIEIEAIIHSIQPVQ